MELTTSKNLSEVELIYRSNSEARPTVKSSTDSYELLKSIYNPNRVQHIEEAIILLLNSPLQVIGWAKISTGGITGTVVDPRIIFQFALKANATGIILSHNHPSGNLKPSETDRGITKRLVEGGRVLEIRLLDHIIYTENGYYSFADEGEI